MLVYRVQTETGRGPYWKDSPIAQILNRKHTGDSFPSFTQDFERFSEWKQYACGFSSIASLKRWFHGCYNLLRKNDFKVCVFDSDFVKIGKSGKQVIFLRDASILLEVLDI